MTRIQTLSGKLQTDEAPALAWRGWVPETPRAALLFVHGLAEHSGRYLRTAVHFAERGFACYGFDLRGHGSSQGRRVHIRPKFRDGNADASCYRSGSPGKGVVSWTGRAIPSPLHGPSPWSLTPPLVPSRLCLEGAPIP